VSGEVGDFPVHAGLVAEGSVIESASPALIRAPSRPSARSNVLQFAARHPESGISPLEALRRVRIASITVMAAVAVVATVGLVVAGLRMMILAPVCWLAAEIVVLQLCRHLDEMGGVADALRRQVLYGMTACVAGVLIQRPDVSLKLLLILGFFASAEVTWLLVLRLPRVRRTIGIASPSSALIVADRSTAAETVEDRAGVSSTNVVGVCLVDGHDREASVAGVPVLGTVDDVVALVQSLNIHEVVVRLESPLDQEWLSELQWSLEELGARLTLVTRLRNTRSGRIKVSGMGSSIVLGVAHARPTGLARRAKAAAEFVLALTLFALSLPLLAVCAVAVRLDSPGPVLFRQTRVRDGDRTFTMLKLRTMHLDAEERRAELEESNEVGGALFKMKADPRVTRVGRVLRKFSLDELPQLLNVMRGEMALIGPRPALPSEVEMYDRRASRRLSVKPGLTGLWQVSGRSRLSWEESVAIDIEYVDNWSPSLDVRIALETVRAVAFKDGAY
jgi:exopolysaccharide biosynthesis polyprenyl glycosylphosphotransferase